MKLLCTSLTMKTIRRHFLKRLFCTTASSSEVTSPHTPVMLQEVCSAFETAPGQTLLDMTFGSGGHTKHILLSTPNVRLYGLDRDPLAISQFGQPLAQKFPGQFYPLLGRFSDLKDCLKRYEVKPGSLDGVLFDFGASSMQFDDPKRGFSVSKDGPLDMRMDAGMVEGQPSAADVVQHADQAALAKILKVYGGEKQGKKIAQAIIEARYLFKRLNTTQELADLVLNVCGNETRLDKLQRPAHVATKTFQALRIFVNNEINELSYGIDLAYKYLKVGGKIVTLTFHSLEDRIVKRHLLGTDLDEAISTTFSQKYRNAATWHSEEEIGKILQRKWKPLYKHVLLPSEVEVERNPRSRSAKLRAAIKVL